MKKPDVWRWVERGVLIAGIVGMFVAWQSDRAVFKSQLQTLIKNDTEREKYWNRQNEINGRIIEYMRHDSGAGTD